MFLTGAEEGFRRGEHGGKTPEGVARDRDRWEKNSVPVKIRAIQITSRQLKAGAQKKNARGVGRRNNTLKVPHETATGRRDRQKKKAAAENTGRTKQQGKGGGKTRLVGEGGSATLARGHPMYESRQKKKNTLRGETVSRGGWLLSKPKKKIRRPTQRPN